MAAVETEQLQRVCSLEELRRDGVRVHSGGGRAIAVFLEGGTVHALDNRCPHMGFPLHRGTVRDGILTCHWHHAKFDLASGCTFDLFADDATSFAVEVRDGEVWLDPRPPQQEGRERWLRKLDDGLEHNVSLVLAKSAIALHELGATEEALARAALFGLRNRAAGWGTGLSILTAMARVLPVLGDEDRPLALFQGLVHLAASTAGHQPNFDVQPLRTGETRPERYLEWFRRFVEVRQGAAAERTLVTAIEVGLGRPAVAGMVFAACTDHLYLDSGHTLDFANKAFELLEVIGWEHARVVLPSLIPVLAGSRRMEESSSWRHPVDIAALLQAASAELLALPGAGVPVDGWDGHERLAEVILDAEPARTLEEIVGLARAGVPLIELSATVAYAAARRALHFSIANEIGDWETVHHAFTYANAVDQAMRRAPSALLARGILDGAMAVSLERFLNVPMRPIPGPSGAAPAPAEILHRFDVHGQADETAQLVADLLADDRDEEALRLLGHALLREDAGFHQVQIFEAGARQWARFRGRPAGHNVLLGVTRYLAAHSPTVRGRGQTYDVALRLHRGDVLHDDAR
jgi:nitrite reductase/ring-hydroxylating ferredoxin subunit